MESSNQQPDDEAMLFSQIDKAEVAKAAGDEVYDMNTVKLQNAVDSATGAGIGALPDELEQEATESAEAA
jgi:hypothetical protein